MLSGKQGGPRRGESGFTLVELMVVLAILALLAGLVSPTLYQRLKPAKQTVARAQIQSLSSALETFYVDLGRFPSSQEGLEALVKNPPSLAKWKGPYLQRDLPLDPWGNPYIYLLPGSKGAYEVISYGADGKAGGMDEDADISSAENK